MCLVQLTQPRYTRVCINIDICFVGSGMLSQEIENEVEREVPVVQSRTRRPSERIIKNKLEKKINGQGSTAESALDVDVA